MMLKKKIDSKNENKMTKSIVKRFANYFLIGSCMLSIGCNDSEMQREERRVSLRESYQRYVKSGKEDENALFDAKRGLDSLKKNMDREESELISKIYIELGADVLKMISGDYQLKEAEIYFDLALRYGEETDTKRVRIVEKYRKFLNECEKKGEVGIAKKTLDYIDKYGF
jgi:hypothetical protein